MNSHKIAPQEMEQEFEIQVEADDINEVKSLVENWTFEDFEVELLPDEDTTKEVIGKSTVGNFFAKRPISNGLLRTVLR